MRSSFFLPILILFFSTSLPAQHYGLLEFGGTLSFYNSDQLKNFTETYNFRNQNNLSKPLSGLNGYEGVRAQAGYRHFGYRLTSAVFVGWQRLTRSSIANFGVGDARLLKFKNTALFMEGEAGKVFGDFFVTAVVALFANRKFELESSYSDVSGLGYIERLDGRYKANTDVAGDLGLAFGFRRNRVFLTTKITHPVFASNRSDRLKDSSATKVNDQSTFFPDDYLRFYDGESYTGVRNNLDGWKISLTLAYAFWFKV